MSSELSELYQQLILDHNSSPRNFGELPNATHHAQGHNPLCGDRCTIQLQVENDRIVDVRFSGSGCAISKASASLMTLNIKGKSIAEVQDTFQKFRALVTGENGGDSEHSGAGGADPSTKPVDTSGLGKLTALAGVREFPMRVKCATLAWHTLRAALDKQQEPVATE